MHSDKCHSISNHLSLPRQLCAIIPVDHLSLLPPRHRHIEELSIIRFSRAEHNIQNSVGAGIDSQVGPFTPHISLHPLQDVC